ncbi:MAG TPA: flavin reductase family protein [Polyangiaceae bacterium]|nr:flavin reductase family protein [Polyangiaceae bacterium]
MDSSVTPDAFKAAMASFAAGVTVITAVDEAGVPYGLTATAFSSVSKTPPLCLVCVSRDADAYPAITRSQRFAVNFLSSDQQAVSATFATHGADKFAALSHRPGRATGCPLLDGALAAIECEVSSVIPAGDHDVFIGAITGIVLGEGAPLVYFRGRYADVRQR